MHDHSKILLGFYTKLNENRCSALLKSSKTWPGVQYIKIIIFVPKKYFIYIYIYIYIYIVEKMLLLCENNTSINVFNDLSPP